LGIVIDVNKIQSWNTESLILPSVEVGVNSTDANAVQLLNAALPILVTELPIITDSNAIQLSNAAAPILVTELGIVIDANAQP
jgi:hypothetical protein